MFSGRTLALCVVAVMAACCTASPIGDLHSQLDAALNVVFAQGETASTVFHSHTTTAMFVVVTNTPTDVAEVSALILAGNVDKSLTSHIGMVHTTFNATMHGLLVSLSPSALLGVAAHLGVALIEQDGPVSVPVSPPQSRRLNTNVDIASTPVGAADVAVEAASAGTQQNAPWDLNRLDQVTLPLDGVYQYNEDGTGVDGTCVWSRDRSAGGCAFSWALFICVRFP